MHLACRYLSLSRTYLFAKQALDEKFTDTALGLDTKVSTITSATEAKLAAQIKTDLAGLDEKFSDTCIGLDQKLMTLLQESSALVTKQAHAQKLENDKLVRSLL